MKQTSFADILYSTIEAKVRAEYQAQGPRTQGEARSPYLEDLSPACLTHLIGNPYLNQTKSEHFKPNPKRTYDKVNPKQTSHTEPSSSKAAPALSPEAHTALWLFRTYGQNLSDSYNLADLKLAFRNLAFKLHPDQGGNPKEFRALVKAHQTLAKAK